jgi:chromosomal replication initiation ATPase DnaA
MMEAVLVKLFADRQIVVAPDVIAYLVRRMDRSFAAARSVVAKADSVSLTGKRPITVPLIKEVLEAD